MLVVCFGMHTKPNVYFCLNVLNKGINMRKCWLHLVPGRNCKTFEFKQFYKVQFWLLLLIVYSVILVLKEYASESPRGLVKTNQPLGLTDLGWSQMISTYSNLKLGFSSQPETEDRLRQWEHQILATRPVVSDQALTLVLRKRIPTKTESTEASKVFIGRKRV